MQWMEIKIVFKDDNDELIVDLVSDRFYALGAKGVVVDDPNLTPALGWGGDAAPRAVRPAVTGYLPIDDRIDPNLRALARSLSDLARANSFAFEMTTKSIVEEDWAESWKTFFHPEKITRRMVVKPTWRDYEAKPGELILEIDPGMAFGTGTHPTTALCIQLLEETIRPGDHILDVGTGSGILLIAAARLGARKLTGVDSDPVAVDVARANLSRNGIDKSHIDLYCGHLLDPIKGQYDVVVANILADVIIHLLADVGRVLKPGGVFISSGIIETRQKAVVDKMAACSLTLTRVMQKQEWVALSSRLSPEIEDLK
jgi:ribosomal protein L11 methyltransferase